MTMKAILVRVAADQTYGSWNGPVDPSSNEFVYVPIPDSLGKEYLPNMVSRYDDVEDAVIRFAQRFNAGSLIFPSWFRHHAAHLDPDFRYLTYGDNGVRRGARIATLLKDDLLIFYSGLRSIHPPHNLVYALIGMLVVQEVVTAIAVPDSKRNENAHTRWIDVSKNDVVVRGIRGSSGRFRQCIPIGEWRERAYRVRRDVEEAWGGLSVNNGFIQRSAVPPWLLDGMRFRCWLADQQVELMERNN